MKKTWSSVLLMTALLAFASGVKANGEKERMIESSFSETPSYMEWEQLFVDLPNGSGGMYRTCELRMNFTTGFVAVNGRFNRSGPFVKKCGFFLDKKVKQVGNKLTVYGVNALDENTHCKVDVTFGTNYDGKKNTPVAVRLSMKEASERVYQEEFGCSLDRVQVSTPNYGMR